jgi:hypothetical protein
MHRLKPCRTPAADPGESHDHDLESGDLRLALRGAGVVGPERRCKNMAQSRPTYTCVEVATRRRYWGLLQHTPTHHRDPSAHHLHNSSMHETVIVFYP